MPRPLKKTKNAEAPLPTIAECVAARTHMLRCTANGFCKVCFDRHDLDEAVLTEIELCP